MAYVKTRLAVFYPSTVVNPTFSPPFTVCNGSLSVLELSDQSRLSRNSNTMAIMNTVLLCINTCHVVYKIAAILSPDLGIEWVGVEYYREKGHELQPSLNLIQIVVL